MNNLIKRVKRVAFGFKNFSQLPIEVSALRGETRLVPTSCSHTPLICEVPPKLLSHESVRATGQRTPIGWFCLGSYDPRFFFFAVIASLIVRSTRCLRDACESHPQSRQIVWM